jgi:hypothetical protein
MPSDVGDPDGGSPRRKLESQRQQGQKGHDRRARHRLLPESPDRRHQGVASAFLLLGIAIPFATLLVFGLPLAIGLAIIVEWMR